MTKKVGLTIGIFLVGLCLAAIVLGLSLLFVANGMPSHTDARRAGELTELYERNYTGAPEKLEAIKKEIVALRTSRWKLHDVGLDMCLFSLPLILAAFSFRLWDLRNLRAIRTPRTRIMLLALSGVALLGLLLPALQLQEDYEYARDDLTPTIDTGHGLALVVGTELFLLLGIPMLLIGRFIVLRRAHLPANLWDWNPANPRRSLTLSICFGLLALGFVTLIVWSAVNFLWAVPSLMVGLYVILSSRAALMRT